MLALLGTFYASAAEKLSPRNDSIINRLDQVLDRRDTYFVSRGFRIDSLKKVARTIDVSDYRARSKAFHDIFEEYGSYQGDSALRYTNLELEAAVKSGITDDIVRARTDMIFTFMSGGNFTDAVETVHGTDLSNASTDVRANFYYTCIRLYSDLSGYTVTDFSDKYARISGLYCDSVLQITRPNTYLHEYALAFSPKAANSADKKIKIFTRLLERKDVNSSVKAMLASMIGDFYRDLEDRENEIYYKALAAILDVEASKRETIAKLDLGHILFEQGDIDRAYRYIDLAKEDADFYNARNRKIQIMNVLPLVEKARYMNLDDRRQRLQITNIIMIALVIAMIVVLWLFFRQMSKVRRARKEIEEQNHEIEKRNGELNAKNHELNEMLERLQESNKIKDEYIGYGFSVHAEYIRKIESIYNLVDTKLMAKQYDELRKSIRRSDIRVQKETMHEEFDRTFLRLFPEFITRYKELFPADDPKNAESNGQNLTSEMRIFALMRLGITDVGDISMFLNYSINTVNTYKTKAKNRSILPNDQFEEAIMKIRSN